VPLSIPYILLILLAINPSLIDFIIGTPPATEASYSKFTLFASARCASSSPYLDINALLAVITCFLFFRAEKTNFFAAPSEPPINSTIISTSSLLARFKEFLTNLSFGIVMFLFFFYIFC